MQSIVFDKPYVPIPPRNSRVWPAILKLWLPRMLRKSFGVVDVTFNHVDRLRESLAAGHGIVLAPNHCRDEDPFLLGMLAKEVKCNLYIMASAHLFMQGKVKRFLLNRAGAFSVYREGIDRASVNSAIDILEHAKRPLVIFPEGFIARTNDKLNDLMEGTAMIARSAAKKRAKLSPAGKVVCHPIALRYRFQGDVERAVAPVLDEIETRVSWRPNRHLPIHQRIHKLGHALLCVKEVMYLNAAGTGTLNERLMKLIEAILSPLEEEWCDKDHSGSIWARVKRIRSAIVPDLVAGELTEAERARRWQALEDVYIAGEMSHYPQDYVHEGCSPDRILETVERFEEDLTDKIRQLGPIKAHITVGTAIEVNPAREGRGAVDPLLAGIESQLKEMLGIGGAKGVDG
ncbi:MAG: 1-acyl-sn-glycerol-3-phosphate acyltransferase [Tepidisphaeraceae bacterium]